MDIRNLQGSIVALVTPFHADGSVNFEKLGELVEWHVGVEGGHQGHNGALEIADVHDSSSFF